MKVLRKESILFMCVLRSHYVRMIMNMMKQPLLLLVMGMSERYFIMLKENMLYIKEHIEFI